MCQILILVIGWSSGNAYLVARAVSPGVANWKRSLASRLHSLAGLPTRGQSQTERAISSKCIRWKVAVNGAAEEALTLRMALMVGVWLCAAALWSYEAAGSGRESPRAPSQW